MLGSKTRTSPYVRLLSKLFTTHPDFVLREGLRISKAIQVSLDLDSPETKKREIEGAVEAMAVYKLDRGFILTFEEEDVLSIHGKKNTVQPIWKWLLE